LTHSCDYDIIKVLFIRKEQYHVHYRNRVKNEPGKISPVGGNRRYFHYPQWPDGCKADISVSNQLLSIIGMMDSAADDVFRAISSEISDFEDAITIEAAIRSRMD